ncbi:MAG: preprotein translocase subunit SecE [Oscillospiraceae bacterium]|jgi:preprotein translocase subunit SecE|nr:preprotein translocase subunit SecE [Oscillospiraceae bacterium]
MSEEKEKTQSPAVTPAAKTPAKKKARRKNPFAKWFREMRSELKKVVWPTPKQIVNNTGVALAVMAASSVAIWALDFVGSEIFRALISLGGN